jgi:hypothetical protein
MDMTPSHSNDFIHGNYSTRELFCQIVIDPPLKCVSTMTRGKLVDPLLHFAQGKYAEIKGLAFTGLHPSDNARIGPGTHYFGNNTCVE